MPFWPDPRALNRQHPCYLRFWPRAACREAILEGCGDAGDAGHGQCPDDGDAGSLQHPHQHPLILANIPSTPSISKAILTVFTVFFEGRAKSRPGAVARPGVSGMFWGPGLLAGLVPGDAGDAEQQFVSNKNCRRYTLRVGLTRSSSSKKHSAAGFFAKRTMLNC